MDNLFNTLRSDSYYDGYSDTDLLKVIEWEKYGSETGAEKFRRNIEKQIEGKEEENTFYSSILKKEKLEAVAINIKTLAEEKKGAGRSGNVLPIIRELDPYTLAAYALEGVLTSLTKGQSVQNTANSIGKRVEAGILAQITSEEAPRFWNKVSRQVKGRRGRYQAGVLKHIIEQLALGKYGEDNATDRLKKLLQTSFKTREVISLWPDDIKIHLGAWLLDVVMRTTGIVEIKKGGMHTPDTIVASPEIMEWIKNSVDNKAIFSPEWIPLPIPPRDWSTPFDGGYHTPLINRYKLISRASKGFLEEVRDNAHMPTVYTTVNAAQRTAWRINKNVYEVAKTFWEGQIKCNALPDAPEVNVPPCPVCGNIPTDEEREAGNHVCFINDEKNFRLWKDASRKAFEERIANGSRNIEVAFTMHAATRYLDEDRFYFPYYLDFRGRLYTRVPYLSPQGAGLGKAMLEFAEGKAISTEEGARWLAIHVANSWGHDKLPFDERVKWTKDNTEMLLAVAADPYEHREWSKLKMKEAWPALAASFEWAGYIREGLAFVSHLPIAQDGTCSGLQHYAALLHDEHTAKQVNVAPGERPNDVYKAVAERTIEILEGLVGDPEHGEKAMAWLETGIINRKLTKRSVMTLPYGATSFSCKDYVYEYYKEALHDKGKVGPWELGAEQHKACCWLGNKVWQAIKDVLTVAPVAMGLLQNTAKEMARQQLPLNWTTPTGFRVQQYNVQYTARRLELALAGDIVYRTIEGRKQGPKVNHDVLPKGFRVTMQEPTDIIDEHKQASGVAPNFIHSLDASAMCLTVSKMVEYGVHSFALIHDSFATHACDSALLAKTLREEFAGMYREKDPLVDLYAEFTMMLKIIEAEDSIKVIKAYQNEMPYGTFNVDKVLDSLYFFA